MKRGFVSGHAGILSFTLKGRDAFSNACCIHAAQVQVTCQPDNALQHVELQADTAEGAVSIHANVVAQGESQAALSAIVCTSSWRRATVIVSDIVIQCPQTNLEKHTMLPSVLGDLGFG